MAQHLPAGYVLDPADPRSPSVEQWAAMTTAERRRVVDMLPAQPDVDFLPPAEGDKHRKATTTAQETLGSFFRRDRKKVYISGNLSVYYPNERVFAPDVIAVLDVEPHERQRWTVIDEGKGIDLAIEIHVAGDRAKDLKTNVERYARLGIHEYFVFDRGRLSLRGYRLPPPDAKLPPADPKKTRAYQPIVPQAGRFASEVLGLDLMVEGTSLRFYLTTAPLLDADERIERIEAAFNDAIKRASDAEERAAAEADARRDAEERAADLQRQVHELQAEIARLKGSGPTD